MTDVPPLDPRDGHAPLHGLTVLEIRGELTGYAGKLLADLGADVILVDVGHDAEPDGALDAEDFFVNHAKRRVEPGDDGAGAEDLASLVARADVVLRDGGPNVPVRPELDPAAVRVRNPRAVQTTLTSFGLDGPAAPAESTDLVRLAAGGLLWLGGYPDAEPVAPFGEQSTVATGIYGAVATLLALIARESSGEGDVVEVSAQEVVVQALETSLAELELLGTVRRRLGDVPREAGTGIFPCADGYVSMVAGRLGTATAWAHLVEWLQESGVPGADVLSGDGWDTLPHRQKPESIAHFTRVFEAFTATRQKNDLYREAQQRGIALAPVNDLEELLADRQLAARSFFRPALEPRTGTAVHLPAPPFRLSPPADATTGSPAQAPPPSTTLPERT